MRNHLCLLILLLSSLIKGQSLKEPEFQKSFAKESRSIEYYLAQADLWWQELQKDSLDELAWWNYYRACRNVQGLHNWQADFVELGPNLRFGADIVLLIEAKIPNSFTYHFIKGSTGGVDPQAGDHLLKAYAMKPEFPGLLAAVVTYSISTHNAELRKEANQKWYQQNGFNANWMDFAWNLLQSVEPNGILFTQGDNDSYPLWLMQDALGIRTDVLVLNIDFLLYDGFQKPVFQELGLKPYRFEKIDPDGYSENWKNIVHYFLSEYQGDRKLHISFTVEPKYYAPFKDQMQIQGMSFRYKAENTSAKNLAYFRETVRLNSYQQSLIADPSAERLKLMTQKYQIYFDALRQEEEQLSEAEIAQLKLLRKK